MKNLKLTLAILFFAISLTSCKQEAVEPKTGTLKIIVGKLFESKNYELYPSQVSAFPYTNQIPSPLSTGLFPDRISNTFTITIDNLNEGNYMLRVGHLFYYVQVTRGELREYRF
jgi:hypothetical protein